MKESPDQLEENTALASTGSQDIVPVEIKEPLATKGIPAEKSQALKGRAADLVKQLEDASGSQELELTGGPRPVFFVSIVMSR